MASMLFESLTKWNFKTKNYFDNNKYSALYLDENVKEG